MVKSISIEKITGAIILASKLICEKKKKYKVNYLKALEHFIVNSKNILLNNYANKRKRSAI